jgi:hypothetical protein
MKGVPWATNPESIPPFEAKIDQGKGDIANGKPLF